MGAGGAWAKGSPAVGCWAGRGSTGPVEDRGACSGCSSAAPGWARAPTQAASCGSSACPTSPPATSSAASSPPKAPSPSREPKDSFTCKCSPASATKLATIMVLLVQKDGLNLYESRPIRPHGCAILVSSSAHRNPAFHH
ncbi:hypothetical protein ACQJBY_048589 [Aegilops geniculata]